MPPQTPPRPPPRPRQPRPPGWHGCSCRALPRPLPRSRPRQILPPGAKAQNPPAPKKHPKTAVKLCPAQTLCPVVPYIQDSLQRNHPRDILPECEIKKVRAWLPNMPDQPYLGHKWN